MEQLLHYTWKHKIFPLRELFTTDGRKIEVLNTGLHNTNAGPDFIGAKVKIDGTTWVGNVEIHVRTSDWHRHHHDTDPNYDNVILHVASIIDERICYPDGNEIPQLQLDVPQNVTDNYDELIRSDKRPRCSNVICELPLLTIHNWMTSLTLERFEERTRQIMQRREFLDKNWEDTLFVTLARNFGFGINGDAFEEWAHSIPMNAVAKHRDNLLQIEAIFFGQAGLLDATYNVGDEHATTINHTTTNDNSYYHTLCCEWKFLQQKFSLTPINRNKWKFLRLRPQNFPHIRIAQLAMMYYEQTFNLSRLIAARSYEDISKMLHTHVSDYWRTHYTFWGEETSTPTDKFLSSSSINLILINTVAPILFAYGKYKSNLQLCDRAFETWQQVKPENNHIIRDWAAAGIKCESAADSQAIIHLSKKYCDNHDCLRCQFGSEFIHRTPELFRENENEMKNGNEN